MSFIAILVLIVILIYCCTQLSSAFGMLAFLWQPLAVLGGLLLVSVALHRRIHVSSPYAVALALFDAAVCSAIWAWGHYLGFSILADILAPFLLFLWSGIPEANPLPEPDDEAADRWTASVRDFSAVRASVYTTTLTLLCIYIYVYEIAFLEFETPYEAISKYGEAAFAGAHELLYIILFLPLFFGFFYVAYHFIRWFFVIKDTESSRGGKQDNPVVSYVSTHLGLVLAAIPTIALAIFVAWQMKTAGPWFQWLEELVFNWMQV